MLNEHLKDLERRANEERAEFECIRAGFRRGIDEALARLSEAPLPTPPRLTLRGRLRLIKRALT